MVIQRVTVNRHARDQGLLHDLIEPVTLRAGVSLTADQHLLLPRNVAIVSN